MIVAGMPVSFALVDVDDCRFSELLEVVALCARRAERGG